MDPLRSETCWSTFKYFIILIVSTYYILCISWIIKCLIIIDVRCKHEYFITVFKKVLHSSLSWSRSIHFTLSILKKHFNIILPSMPWFYKWIFKNSLDIYCKIFKRHKNLFQMKPTRCTLLLSMFISTSVHVSGSYMPIIRRIYCICATLVLFTLYGWLSGLHTVSSPDDGHTVARNM